MEHNKHILTPNSAAIQFYTHSNNVFLLAHFGARTIILKFNALYDFKNSETVL